MAITVESTASPVAASFISVILARDGRARRRYRRAAETELNYNVTRKRRLQFASKCMYYCSRCDSNPSCVTYLSFTLMVRSASSMSMRILYLTYGGGWLEFGWRFSKTMAAQNVSFCRSSSALLTRWLSVGTASNLSSSKHCQRIQRHHKNMNGFFNIIIPVLHTFSIHKIGEIGRAHV